MEHRHTGQRSAGATAQWALRAALLFALLAHAAQAADVLKIGSKRFTESYVLGELLARTAGAHGPVQYRAGLGSTAILYAALRASTIDVYPEYSGTIAREILKQEGNHTLAQINRALAAEGLAASVALGFNNSYALGVREELSVRLGLRSIGDLARHPELRLGFSQEFLARKDGWPGLAQAYGLASFSPTGLDHGLAYEALERHRIDVIDTYSTDAKIARYGVRLLADDRGYFPRYDALLLHRVDVPGRFPQQWRDLSALQGRIDEHTMLRMNAAVEIEGRSFGQAASLYFDQRAAGAGPSTGSRGFLDDLFAPDLARLTREHLLLVFSSLIASIAVGVPLGVAAARMSWLAQPIFALAGIVQTIPSLALLAFLIAMMGMIGTLPAAVALFVYALLPIIRSTHTGMLAVGEGVRQAALALGLSPRDRLLLIEMPLARSSILGGVKTSAVINVGTATIAAFVGAGGYGERIVSGLAVNDNALLLAGALPAAVLALLIQGLFDLFERRSDPLRRTSAAAHQ